MLTAEEQAWVDSILGPATTAPRPRVTASTHRHVIGAGRVANTPIDRALRAYLHADEATNSLDAGAWLAAARMWRAIARAKEGSK